MGSRTRVASARPHDPADTRRKRNGQFGPPVPIVDREVVPRRVVDHPILLRCHQALLAAVQLLNQTSLIRTALAERGEERLDQHRHLGCRIGLVGA